MVQLDILNIGNLVRDESGNILEANSSSTLVRADDLIIVVDTSTSYMQPALKTAFKQIGVYPKDVTTVVLTHSHSDHIGNLSMFPKAEILMHTGEKGKIPGAKLIDKDMELTKGVRLVHTPGHTMGSMSVFVDGDMKYAIVGDAIPKKGNFIDMKPPTVNVDAELALKSIKIVGQYADMVVPGHDYPFMTER